VLHELRHRAVIHFHESAVEQLVAERVIIVGDGQRRRRKGGDFGRLPKFLAHAIDGVAALAVDADRVGELIHAATGVEGDGDKHPGDHRAEAGGDHEFNQRKG